jgi:glutamate 5-kinase
MIVVAKVGTSSLTDATGEVVAEPLLKLCAEIAATRAAGHEVVLVSSGAIAAGLPALGLERRPTDIGTLQAIAAIGQPRLMERFSAILSTHGVVAGQVLLTPYDFIHRTQYLHARQTLRRLLDLGAVPIVNENDTVADDEIRYGDNDRLAALVAHLVGADLLLLLTDTSGLMTADPRVDEAATLIEEIAEVDAALEAVAGGTGSVRGSGGMASKLAAAKIAAWSGVRAVIAAAAVPDVIPRAVSGEAVGTAVLPRAKRLNSRKLWIAFAQGAHGRLMVDDGARRALIERGTSLLPVGVAGVSGEFDAGDAVEIAFDGEVVGKGICNYSAAELRQVRGLKSAEVRDRFPRATEEAVHRDYFVLA